MKSVYSYLLCLTLGALGHLSRAAEPAPVPLTLRQAQEIALQKHPKITGAELKARAARQATTEVKAAFFPSLFANATAVGTENDNTRVAAGSLNNGTVFSRAAEGLFVTQMITDFGRTANLAASAKFRAQAEEENAGATRAQILLEVTTAYFNALQAQSLKQVAEQTVVTRQLIFDQVKALADNKLKSELDANFARVTLDEGKLLLVKAENNLRAAFAGLSALLNLREPQPFALSEEPGPPNVPADVAPLINQALAQRPELARRRLEREAAAKSAKAEKALRYPTISAIGAAGLTEFHDSRMEDHYAAAGVNLNFPLFTGRLYSARQAEAELRAQAAAEALHDEETTIIRDVRVAWLNANYAYERRDLTAKLLASATQAFDLAQARYKIGASSMVELSQAQLNKTAAEIAQTSANYDCQIQRAILNFQSGQWSESPATGPGPNPSH